MFLFRLTLWLGNLIELLGLGVSVMLILLAPSLSGNQLVSLIVYGASWAGLFVFSHCIVHFLVGSLVGVKFSHYVLAPSGLSKLSLPLTSLAKLVPIPGIRTKKASLGKASKAAKRAMFASGTIASMVVPVISPILALLRGLTLVASLLGIATLANILFTLYYSPRAGDLSRAKKA